MIGALLCIIAIIWVAVEVNSEERKQKANHRELQRHYNGFYSANETEQEKHQEPAIDFVDAV